MHERLTLITERVDDIPLLLEQMQRMGLPTFNRLRVFWRVVCALLGASGGPERETRPVPSEKWAVRWGSERDEMRMITASFTRVREQWPGHSCLHFSLKYQRLVRIGKTRNQL